MFESPLKKNPYLQSIVENLPDTPGCYQYLNKEGTVIYVGKAKNLKRRVSQYFQKEQTGKTRVLVAQIADIRYVVVSREEDALLLENNLIKKYKPRYNVLLKDDKTYPSICITSEYFPKVFKTRKLLRNGSQYYGPYSHMPTLNEILSLIKQVYMVRTCNLALTPENIRSGKFKPCLDYHIKRCKAPCIALQSREEYMQQIDEIRQILRGNTKELSRQLMERMKRLSEELRFEEAMELKRKYDALERFREKSEVVSHIIDNIDVFSIEEEGESAFINYLHITNGAINQAFTFEYKKKMNETREELLALGIVEMRERYKSRSPEIVVPFAVDMDLEGVTFTIPQRSDRKKLLELSQLNVKQYKLDRLKQADKLNPEQKNTRLLKEIQEHLKLEKLPAHIECFDNSNISGTDAVAACIVFRMGKPSKQEYRKYNIRTVVGPDDYASMREVVHRRYSRMVAEGTPLPDLIIADGGKGQMEVMREVVEDELGLHIPIAGLAKNDRHRTAELLFGFPTLSVGLKQQSALFHLLERIQDEVHRFAITFHRDKRSKRQTASVLDNIKGVGPKAKEALLAHFKSVKRIKEASMEEIAAIIGKSKAEKLVEALKKG